MEKVEILERLKALGLDKKSILANALKISERTIEKWFLPDGNFPNWFPGSLHLLEENNLQAKKIEVLEQEFKQLNGVNLGNMSLEELNSLIPNEQKSRACLNQKETADLLGVSSSTLQNWREVSNSLPYIKVGNGKRSRVMYSKKAILEFLNRNSM